MLDFAEYEGSAGQGNPKVRTPAAVRTTHKIVQIQGDLRDEAK